MFESVLLEICGVLSSSSVYRYFYFDLGLLLVLILYNNIMFWLMVHDWIPFFVETKVGCVEAAFGKLKSSSRVSEDYMRFLDRSHG